MSAIPPRFIRQKDAPAYLGMGVTDFNKRVRPFVTVIQRSRYIFYDRLDLDAWADQFKAANGVPGINLENISWQNQAPDLEKEAVSGILKRPSPDSAFTKALEKRTSKRRSAT